MKGKNENSILNYLGKKCFYVDRVTFKKEYDGRCLGVCIEESMHNLHKLPICYFEKPFLGFKWLYKSEIRLYP